MTHLDTDSYYSSNAQSYFSKTKSLDSSGFLLPFAGKLKVDDPVLDLGCGSGRDLLWLKTKGFQPTGVEKSRELARLARDYSGCHVIEGDYRTFDFSGIYAKGILFSASLVHVPHIQVEAAIQNTLRALKNGGFVYISLKKGQGIKYDLDQRIFYLWEDGDARMLFDALGLKTLYFQESVSVRNTEEIWLSYSMSYEINHDAETEE
ncbi:MAG: class I SAM-dependent methyltransferase [Proteobacteria bacterium]|nr:class I SAM-dependent methyltransferase [Pseudomonadota bacterium]